MTFNIDKVPAQAGKVAIVTGANNGLGFETTMALAKKEIEVVMACRNLDKAEEAKAKIMKVNRKAKLHVMELDLSELDSVREFAGAFTKKYNRLDFLINNAGIMMPPFSLTEDGFESQFATNYLGHFLLTKLLFSTIKNTPEARIVSLSSLAHKWKDIQFDDINFKKSYSKRDAYGQSKFACLMFAIEFDKRLKEANINAKSLAAHPGVSATNLFNNMPKPVAWFTSIFGSFFVQPAKDGALPSLYAALGSDLAGGEYTGPEGKGEMKGDATIVKPRRAAKNEVMADRLWSVSEEMIGEDFVVQ
ncbi:MAG: oxidoreductase [Spirosomaceae bacterium]|nr:oxidoreductase [Spirosomataceae bacterium]